MGGIIGVWSILYSKFPGYAIRRVDQVLAPGGAFKSIFLSESSKTHPDCQTHHGFSDELQRLGYDYSRKWYGLMSVVTAIKPTENPITTAAELARADYLSWESQAQAMRQLIMLESP